VKRTIAAILILLQCLGEWAPARFRIFYKPTYTPSYRPTYTPPPSYKPSASSLSNPLYKSSLYGSLYGSSSRPYSEFGVVRPGWLGDLGDPWVILSSGRMAAGAKQMEELSRIMMEKDPAVRTQKLIAYYLNSSLAGYDPLLGRSNYSIPRTFASKPKRPCKEWTGVEWSFERTHENEFEQTSEPVALLTDFFSRYLKITDPLAGKVATALEAWGAQKARPFCEAILQRVNPPAVEGAQPKQEQTAPLTPEQRVEILRQMAEEQYILWKPLMTEAEALQKAFAPAPAPASAAVPVSVPATPVAHAWPGRVVLNSAQTFRQLRNSYPKAHFVLQNSRHPDKGLAALSAVPRSCRVAFDVPTTRLEAVRMYGGKLPFSWEHQTKYFARTLTTLGAAKLSGGKPEAQAGTGEKQEHPSSMAGEWQRLLKQKADDELLVLVAHAANGEFIFSDGSRLPVSEVKQKNPLAVPVVCIACDTLTHWGDEPGVYHATARSISYDEAIHQVQRFLDGVKNGSPVGDSFHRIQLDELENSGFKPTPAIPAATGQASMQLVEVTNPGVLSAGADAAVLGLAARAPRGDARYFVLCSHTAAGP